MNVDELALAIEVVWRSPEGRDVMPGPLVESGRSLAVAILQALDGQHGDKASGGYIFGRTPGTGEVGNGAVCAHGMNLGWACGGCAKELGRKAGTAPAGPKADMKYRAVCQSCGERTWMLSADVPERIREIVDSEEEAALGEARKRHDEAFA